MASLKSKRKQLKVRAVAPKLKLFRANEPLLSVFMWGINHSVSYIEANVSTKVCVSSYVWILNTVSNTVTVYYHFGMKWVCHL